MIEAVRREPLAFFTLVVTLALGLVNNNSFMSLFESSLDVVVGSDIDSYGRCVDREIFIINNKDVVATNIRLAIEVDYLARQGVVEISYGDEVDLLIGPGAETVIPKRPRMPVKYRFDTDLNEVVIPKLSPGEYLHLFYGGYSNVDEVKGRVREDLIKKGASEFMDKPRVLYALFDGGRIYPKAASASNCRKDSGSAAGF